MNELIVPDEALGDDKALELARVWAAGGKQHVSIRAGIWNDPGAWGIMLADLARHIANSYGDFEGRDKVTTLKRIVEAFNVEVNNPT